MPEAAAVRDTFAGIARRYDLANRVMSGGLDITWRNRMVAMVKAQEPRVVVDLATGSGDVAFALRNRLPATATVTGLDFCEPMLDEARKKQTASEQFRVADLAFAFGDCLNLPLEDESVDAITIAWGVRNLEDRHRGFEEMYRVLRKPGGTVYILEFSQPEGWIRPFYYFYLKRIIPLVSGLLTGKRGAYNYLAGSVEAYPTRDEISEELRVAGFANVEAISILCSIEAIHVART